MNILLIEDHPIFRFGVRQIILQRWPQAQIAEVGTMAEALLAARKAHWQIAIVDLNLPDAEGVEVVSGLFRCAPDLRMLVLSLNEEKAYAQRVLQMGAAGYLEKDRALEELVAAIERIVGGGRYISASLAEHLADRVAGHNRTNPHEELSTQEYRVMLQLAAGQRVGGIADSMHLSPKTVSTYRTRVFEKLEVTSNVELARYCLRHGLLGKHDPFV